MKFDRKVPQRCIEFQQDSWKQIGMRCLQKLNREIHWVGSYTSELISSGKIVSWVDWLDTCSALTRASVGAHSLWACKVSQPCRKHLQEVSSSGYRATFIFHFVSCWLKSKLKVKRLISCRNSYEDCVLTGISPAILSFPCRKGVKCSFGSREDTWPLVTRLQTVQRLFSEQNWFTLFSHVQHTDMTSRSSMLSTRDLLV